MSSLVDQFLEDNDFVASLTNNQGIIIDTKQQEVQQIQKGKYNFYDDDSESQKDDDDDKERREAVDINKNKSKKYSFDSSDSDESQKDLKQAKQSDSEEYSKEDEHENEEEVDFYQFSDNSQLLEASNQKQKQHDDPYSPSKAILQSSIAKVASLLDSQVQNYDKMFSSSGGSLSNRIDDYMKKPETEMTFGDLSSSETSYKEPVITTSLNKKSTTVKDIYKYPIQEETEEELNSSYSLSYSQMTLANNNFSSGFNKLKVHQPVQEGNKALGLIVKILLSREDRLMQDKAFNKWKTENIKEFYGIKLKNAASMVDKMSKFSRSFISLNSLNAILVKNRQRQLAKALIRWSKIQPNHPRIKNNSEEIEQLKQQLDAKDQELVKMEHMFKEYSNWRIKLEQIEQKMKSEIEFWKNASEKLQKENEKLQKEAIKVTQQLMERTKEIESKSETVEHLQKKLKQAKAQLEPVEEAVCQNCKNSLEESQIFHKDTFNQQEYQMIKELNDKLIDLEKQVMTYRERVCYHESVEEELKKNIEQQVDVVLKMEEERLLLLKETKETKDKNRSLIFENEECKTKLNIFETELEELRVQVKSFQDNQPDDTNEIESTTTNKSNKENKTSNTSILKKKSKPVQKKQQLKFQTQTGQKIGENSAIFSSLKMTQLEDSTKSKAGQEPINKSLVTDNQILTNELIVMNREINKLKAELRSTSETLKKSEKEKYDSKKNLEGKENALEKLRKERDELWSVVNTDKYKTLRTIEQEKEKLEKSKQDLEIQIQQIREQMSQKEQQISSIELKLQEVEYQNQRLKEKEDSREKLLSVLEDKSRKFEKELNETENQTSLCKKEVDTLKNENIKLKKDVEWLANSAKNNKNQADRAIADLEAYTKILRGMEKKLAEVEIERESKETELRELRQKFMQVVQGFNAQPTPQPQQQWSAPMQAPQQMWQQPQIMQQQQQYPKAQQCVPQPHQPPQRFQRDPNQY